MLHSSFLYVVTFDTPHTYIKTFTSNEKPAKVYQDHMDVYNNLKYFDATDKPKYDINALVKEMVDQENLKLTKHD